MFVSDFTHILTLGIYRLPAYHTLDHLWFAVPAFARVYSQPSSPSFIQLLTLYLHVGVLEEALPVVTPSFDFSIHQFSVENFKFCNVTSFITSSLS